LAATSYVTAPLPVPDAPPAIVMNDAPDDALQEQSAPAVTVTLWRAPPATTDWASGVTLYEQGAGGGASCVTVNVTPLTVRVPDLAAAPGFGVTVNAEMPVPVPAVGPVSVMKAALLAADQLQVLGVMTSTEAAPPVDGSVVAAGASRIVQTTGAPAWLTVSVRSLTDSVPVRLAGSVLAATVNCTGPLPVPLAGDVRESQSAWGVAVQSQPAPAVTVTVFAPPAAAASMAVCDSENVQGTTSS
jgi:hypothetical protein